MQAFLRAVCGFFEKISAVFRYFLRAAPFPLAKRGKVCYKDSE
jgi:hypothetical protein